MCKDPIVAAAALVTDVQTLVSRNCDPMHTAVVSICSLHAGEANNVIPETAEIEGTIRSFSEHSRKLAHEGLQRETGSGGAGAA